MEPIVSKSLPVSLNQHRSHGPILGFRGMLHTDINLVLQAKRSQHMNITGQRYSEGV